MSLRPPRLSNVFCLAMFGCALIACDVARAQTANDAVPVYDAPFGQGMNFGWYPGWKDEQLGELSIGTPDGTVPGVGVNVLRPALFGHFLEYYGYDIREETFALYQSLGANYNTLFLDEPDQHTQRGTEQWCPGQRTHLFGGMWEPIWDDGNGTPYNEANLYAAFLYKTIEIYGPYVKIYEIWNEPDIGDGPNPGWMGKDDPDSWFNVTVDPCDLKMKAPVQAYVRMLRISYEVVKRLDPEAYVAVGGLGSAGFLDQVLRTTDEPTSGRVTGEYPLTGGAYFDAISFHVYPHIEGSMREWNNDAQRFDYTRTSDLAVNAFIDKHNDFEEVLGDYGYDGSVYPDKVEICTETAFPRIGFDEPGAATATPQQQRNYMLKTFAHAQRLDIKQVHPYQIADNPFEGSSEGEFLHMGFYEDITDKDVFSVKRTEVGIASATYGELLRGAEYDADLTAELALPAGAEGIGYRLPTGRTAYLLWAKTYLDGVEDNTLAYEPSGDLATGSHVSMGWDYNVTGDYDFVTGTITLSGEPTFFVDGAELGLTPGTSGPPVVEFGFQPNSELVIYPNPASGGAGALTVELPASSVDWTVSVFDDLGRNVGSFSAAAAETSTDVPVGAASLTAGSYRVTAVAGEQSLGGSFIME